MRTSRPKDETRRWPAFFLSLLRERHPDYAPNAAAKGVLTECLRPAGDGLVWSQSTVWLRGYHHCFAVLLAPAVGGPLFSPFVAGGRFDHNRTIATAFERDLELPPRRPDRPRGLHSTHDWRDGTEEIVRSCTANAEAHLAPHYRRVVLGARPLLVELVAAARRHARDLDDPAFVARYAPHRAACLDVRMEDLAAPRAEWARIPAAEWGAALVAANAELYRAQLPYLDELASALERMAAE